MPVQRLRQFLDDHDTKYVVISHSPAFTAQEIAASAHISGREVAKTVMVKLDGDMAMAVLPASHKLKFDWLQEAVDADNAELADEEEFEALFPDCEVGAMPPFGNLYDIDVWVDESLADDEEIAFNAGNHHELVQMSYDDFDGLVDARKGRFAVHPKG